MPDRIRTAFLDRDGVINRKAPDGRYVTCWEEFEFLPGAIEALQRLTRSGIGIVVVTNQRGVATGQMRLADVEAVNNRMVSELAAADAVIDAVFTCPHDIGECDCRKPGIGLFRQAVSAFPDLDLRTSMMVGDSRADIEAGRCAGCRTFLVGDLARRSSILGSFSVAVDGQADSLLDVVEGLLEPDD